MIASTTISYIARAGYGAKTVVYILLGIFVITTAFTFLQSEEPTQDHVFRTLLEQPFGWYLLAGVVCGLVCYMLWRLIQAFLNTENLDMSKAGDVITRAFFVLSATIYGVGALGATKVLIGTGNSEQDSSKQVSQELMQQAWGEWLVAAIGTGILIFSFIQLKHACKADFMEKFNTHHMRDSEIHISRIAGRLGYLARGVVYILVGAFFIQAAIERDPSEAGGLKEAFSTILNQRYGQYGLAATGAGIAMFGIFCGFETIYRITPGNR